MAANSSVLIPFSASTSGKGIKVVQTATAGTAIHVTGAVSTVIDRLYVWAYNGHTADVLLTLEWGGVTVPDNTIVSTIPFKAGLVFVVDGLPLVQTGGALTVGAFAATGNVIVLYGYILRITP